MQWMRLKGLHCALLPPLSGLKLAQQNRGKKWSCKHSSGVNGTAEQRAAVYEKRLKRRARNQQIRSWLTVDGDSPNPRSRHFEDKHAQLRFWSQDRRSRKGFEQRRGRGSRDHAGWKKPKPWAADGRHRQKYSGASHWEEEFVRQWNGSRGDSSNSEWPFQERFTSDHRDNFWVRYEDVWAHLNFQYSSSQRQDKYFWSHKQQSFYQPRNEDVAVRQHLQNLGLQTASGLTGEVLKRTYHKCALIWHPDKHCRDEGIRTQAEEKFKTIKSSYQFLQAHIDK